MSVTATEKKPYTLDLSLANQITMTWGRDPVIRIKILRENDGKLMCRQCSDHWCRHIEALITQGDDASLMFAAEAEPHGSGIKIPMVPSHDLYAEIRTGSEHPAGGWEAHLLVPYLPLKDGLLDLQFMGFFNPRHGEGRSVLRMMIRDWIVSNWTVKPNCKVTAHNFTSERVMQANLADPEKHWPEYFCLWSNGVCLGCHKAMNDLTDDGLVPF